MNKLFKKYNYEAIKAIQILTGYLKNYHSSFKGIIMVWGPQPKS